MKAKVRFSHILSVIFALLLTISAFSVFADGLADGDWIYERTTSDNEYYIKSYTGTSDKIRIPALFQMKPVTKITNNAFYDNSVISYAEISATIKEIGSTSFYGCNSLSEVVFLGDVETIGANAFYGCTKLSSVKMDRVTSLKEIPVHCFNSCLNLKTFTVPDGVEIIGDRAFLGCISLEYIIIPDSVTEIGELTFKNCSDFTIYGYDGSYAQQFAQENEIPFVILDGTSLPPEPDATLPTDATAGTTDADTSESTEPSSEDVTVPSDNNSDPTEPSYGEDTPEDPTQETSDPEGAEDTIPSNPEVTLPDDDPFAPDTTEPPSQTESTSQTETSDTSENTEPSSSENVKTKYLIGDVDLSGKVTVKDATLIQKYAASLVQLERIQLFLGNCNSVGDVNVKDATQIQKYCAGFLNILFVGQEVEV